MTKKRIAKTTPRKGKVARRTVTKRKRSRRMNEAQGASGWEIIPFVIAVIIAIIVIVESIDSATDTLPRPTETALRTHMTAGCEVSGVALREIRGSERGVERGMALLEEAQHQIDWDCSTDPHGSLCSHAKVNLQKVNMLLQEEIISLQKARIEACL